MTDREAVPREAPVLAPPAPSAPVVRAVQRVLAPTVQARLTVGAVDDPAEREADDVARAVMRVIDAPAPARPLGDEAGSASVARRIQRSASAPTVGLEGGDVDPDTASRIQRARGGGAPMDDSVRRSMEDGFGADFSNVRIHTGSSANDLNGRLQAKAFTTGSDIFFSNGTYRPESSGGRELLAHELTHTLQQGATRRRVRRSVRIPSATSAHDGVRVQRRLAFTSADLGGSLSKTAKVKRFFGAESTYSKIERALATYESADGWAEQLEALNTLKTLAETWLANHAKEDDGDKKASITDLLNKVKLEIPVAQQGVQDDADEQAAYVDSIKSGGLKFLSQGGKSLAKKVEKWKDAVDLLTDQEHAANKMIAQYQLTLAEAMAIGMYTADDYKYINPALADNDGWMEAMLPRLGLANLTVLRQVQTKVTPELITAAKIEGTLHGKIAVSGMKKLPDWKGSTFRGLGLTPSQFASEYPLKGQAVFKAFSSTSLKEAVSRSFAGSETKEGKVGVLLRLQVSRGKDIAMLSNSPGEKEILLMPGASFQVVKITDGDHRGKPIKIVDLKQVS